MTFLLLPFEVGLTLLIALQRAYVAFILKCVVVASEGSFNLITFSCF